jgi:hypothetical protein
MRLSILFSIPVFSILACSEYSLEEKKEPDLGEDAVEDTAEPVPVGDPPVADCSVAPNPVTPPFTAATWDGSASYDPNELEIVSYEWELIEKPEGSEAIFDVTTGVEIPDFYADLAGDYVGQLTVTNSDGLSASCEARLEAIPAQNLWVEMFWQHSGDDMDLHLLAPNGILESDTDCYYANCKAGDPNDPWYSGGLDWGIQGVIEDDPFLDLDDISAAGPENINIESPETAGEYKVVVHDYPGSVYQDANEVTVNVYLDGILLWTNTKAISGEDSYTEFAIINWGTGTVTGL